MGKFGEFGESSVIRHTYTYRYSVLAIRITIIMYCMPKKLQKKYLVLYKTYHGPTMHELRNVYSRTTDGIHYFL